jgi:hypothetical protein
MHHTFGKHEVFRKSAVNIKLVQGVLFRRDYANVVMKLRVLQRLGILD